MRKTKFLFLIAMVIVLIIALCACDGSNTDNVHDSVDTRVIDNCTHKFVDKYCIYCGEEYYTDGLEFLPSPELDGTYSIVGYKGMDNNVYIPQKHRNGIVTRINDDAFTNIIGLKNVRVPDSVDYVGYNAFDNQLGMTVNQME